MRRYRFFLVTFALVLAATALPRMAAADATSIADMLPVASDTPTPSPSATPTPTATNTPVASATPDPSGLANTGVDVTLPFGVASLGIVGLSAYQLRRRTR